MTPPAGPGLTNCYLKNVVLNLKAITLCLSFRVFCAT